MSLWIAKFLLMSSMSRIHGPRYSALRAARTLVFRAGKKSKRNFPFRKRYFSHQWAMGENACICAGYLSLSESYPVWRISK